MPFSSACSLLRPFFAGDAGYKAVYDGGSLASLKSGTNVRLLLAEKDIHLMRDSSDLKVLPASAITEISYGQDVHRRAGSAIALGVVSLGAGALLALSKSKKHFVGLTWQDDDAKGGFVMQCDKNEYRGILAGLEGITGKKAVNSDAMTVKN